MPFLFLCLFFLAGCTSAVFEYAQARYPRCEVLLLDETGDSVRVLVACPGSAPFEQTFRSR